MSNLSEELWPVQNREDRFAVADRQVQTNLAGTQQEVMVMPRTKTITRLRSTKAPAFSRVKKLNLQPNPHIRTMLIAAGAEVQKILEKKEQMARPLENVLRAIVK